MMQAIFSDHRRACATVRHIDYERVDYDRTDPSLENPCEDNNI